MLLPLLAILVGLVLLVWSADRFVDGSAITARHFGVPPLLIGMVIVGFGTSAPELVVSALAAAQGNPGIALGNVIGSNFFNTLAVVGIAGSISPLAAAPEIFNRDMSVLAGITLLLTVFAWGRGRKPPRINRLEGGILLACFAGYTVYLIATAF